MPKNKISRYFSCCFLLRRKAKYNREIDSEPYIQPVYKIILLLCIKAEGTRVQNFYRHDCRDDYLDFLHVNFWRTIVTFQNWKRNKLIFLTPVLLWKRSVEISLFFPVEKSFNSVYGVRPDLIINVTVAMVDSISGLNMFYIYTIHLFFVLLCKCTEELKKYISLRNILMVKWVVRCIIYSKNNLHFILSYWFCEYDMVSFGIYFLLNLVHLWFLKCVNLRLSKSSILTK